MDDPLEEGDSPPNVDESDPPAEDDEFMELEFADRQPPKLIRASAAGHSKRGRTFFDLLCCTVLGSLLDL